MKILRLSLLVAPCRSLSLSLNPCDSLSLLVTPCRSPGMLLSRIEILIYGCCPAQAATIRQDYRATLLLDGGGFTLR